VRFHLPTAEERAVLKVQVPLFLAVSLLLSLAYHGQREVRAIADREHVQQLLRGWDGFAWFVWLLAAPAMLVLIRRFPLMRGQVRRSLAGLLLGSGVIYLVVANLRFLLRILPNVWLPDAADLPVDWSHYEVSTLLLLPMDFMTYCGFFSASFAIDYYFKYRQRAEEALQLQLHAAQLQSDLARAELTTLRGQLHPHFLFNSFNAVASLVRQRRNESAVEIIAQLSTLLRLAAERTGRQELPLDEELDFIRRYLEIEQVRFGEKLRLDFAFDPSALDAAVPNLLLQPLVENAIKHGISRRTQPGTVRLAARRVDGRLHLEVSDDGPDGSPVERTAAETRKGGIGLSNTRMRLEKIYGTNYRLEMTPRPGGGMLVQLDLPWRPVPAHEPAI
jgi:two-component system LytT family sensor kinase